MGEPRRVDDKWGGMAPPLEDSGISRYGRTKLTLAEHEMLGP